MQSPFCGAGRRGTEQKATSGQRQPGLQVSLGSTHPEAKRNHAHTHLWPYTAVQKICLTTIREAEGCKCNVEPDTPAVWAIQPVSACAMHSKAERCTWVHCGFQEGVSCLCALSAARVAEGRTVFSPSTTERQRCCDVKVCCADRVSKAPVLPELLRRRFSPCSLQWKESGVTEL